MIVAGHRVLALRVSYIGEFGWELHMPMAAMQPVYATLLKAGQPHGIGHYGLYAANGMRLEKGYRGWGSDLTTERSPLESGLGVFVKSDCPAMSERPNDWDMVLLEVQSDEAHPFYAHGLWQGDRSVGIVTSAAYGHRTGKMLALAYLRDVSARENLTIEILGKRVPAVILDQPPYDPENRRLRQTGEMT